ncbi:MAG: AIR synthase-related protein, partial [Planctomycetota bacterium]|jgi:phosphoribosylformylglycinamidine (FGAM) synthase-like enzyme
MEIELAAVPTSVSARRDHEILFAESNTRFLVAVAPDAVPQFKDVMKGLPCAQVGEVMREKRLRITGRDGRKKVIDLTLDRMREAWKRPLAW